MSKSHSIHNFKLFCLILCPWVYGNDLLTQWKTFPKQHLVTKDQNPSFTQTFQASESKSYEYEDLIVFSLRAMIAAFHFDPKTFIEDQKKLSTYFEPHAIAQIEQTLFAASGSGLLDINILEQKSSDAITRAPAIIEKKAPHFVQIRLPIVLTDRRTIDAILSIKIANELKVTDFSIEEAQEG